MSGKEGKITRKDFVKWFSELNKDSGPYAGGKGANLGEMYNAKIPVPPGFVITAQAYDYFIEEAGIKDKIKELLDSLEYENTEQLDQVTNEIRKLVTDSEMPKEMQEEILEAYEHLDIPEANTTDQNALDILKRSTEPVFVAVRSSATTEDLVEASFAGQQDTYLNIKGKNDLLKYVKKCFASLFTSRATYYRNKKGFAHGEASLAVVVQKMVNADKSGVVFSKDPTYNKDNVIIEAVFGLGEGIVSGQITPDKYIISKGLDILKKEIKIKLKAITRDSSGNQIKKKLSEEKSKEQVLDNHEIKKVSELALRLEDHYDKPQDIEFAVESGEIYIVQSRPITTMERRIDEKASSSISGEIILEGMAASPGIAAGKVKLIEKMEDLKKIIKGDILVTGMTNPDMVVTMQKCSAIITDEGGMTAHAAIVSREMGIPCIVGTGKATEVLKDEQEVTVDGYFGKVYKGKIAETEKKEIKPVETETKTDIKVIVDLPSFAERASKTGIKKVGLTRIEGIIAESGKHPNYFLHRGNIDEYEEIIYKGISGIAEYFDEMWVRTSDIRTNEYKNLEGAPQELEDNPMLGMHGVRFSLKYPKILKAELKALKRIAEEGKTVGILLPQLISVDELKKVKEHLKEIEFTNLKVGVMVETPAAVQIIKSLCEEGIDFISFGTNDLTQYILAVDRGNSEVQDLYSEMHPAVLYQMGYVIRICKKYNVESSICGQAGSRKEMAKYLVEKGIDSISVNADVANEIAEYVSKIEKGENPDIENKEENIDEKNNEQKSEKEDKENQGDLVIEEDKKNALTEGERGEIIQKDPYNNQQLERDISAIESEKEKSLEKEQVN
jgi:pyruvate, water dikinase